MFIFNQAFVNLVLTLCDAGDSVVMFAPYYFNAYMSFQMTGVTDILVGPNDPATLQPNAGNLRFKQCFSTHILHGETLKYPRANYLFFQMPPKFFFSKCLSATPSLANTCVICIIICSMQLFLNSSRSSLVQWLNRCILGKDEN